MAEFKAISEAAFEKAARKSRSFRPHAVSAKYDKRSRRITVRLDTGIDFSFDPKQAYGLEDAAEHDLTGVTVEGAGGALHFPQLDADFSVAGLLEGFLGPLEWTRREARAAASRKNGKLGGRPKKTSSAVALKSRKRRTKARKIAASA